METEAIGQVMTRLIDRAQSPEPPRTPLDSSKASELNERDGIDIPPTYRRWTLADYSEQIREAIAPFILGETWSLYLHGNAGSRKSSIAAAVLRVMRATAPGCRLSGFYQFIESSTLRRATLDSDWGGPRIEAWGEASMLVLDDIGATRTTDVVVDTLVRIIASRYNHRRPTIATGNLDLQRLADALDPRIASRLQEGVVLDLGERDWRNAPRTPAELVAAL